MKSKTRYVLGMLFCLPAFLQAQNRDSGVIPVTITLKKASFATVVIDDAAGIRVKNLIANSWFPAGSTTLHWDGLTESGDPAKHNKVVAPGAYQVGVLTHDGIKLRYQLSLYTNGKPAWGAGNNYYLPGPSAGGGASPTVKTAGGWLADHSPPSAVEYIPSKGLVGIGSAWVEGGSGLAMVDLKGTKVAGMSHIGIAWTAAEYTARDRGPSPAPDTWMYTAVVNGSTLAFYAFKQTNLVESAVIQSTAVEMFGLAAYNGIVVLPINTTGTSGNSGTGFLRVVNAKTKTLVKDVPFATPGPVAFVNANTLLIAAGTELARYTLTVDGASTAVSGKSVLATGLDHPAGITTDDQGNIYVSQMGTRNCVNKYSPTGTLLLTLGNPGQIVLGTYDPTRMSCPKGLTVDSLGRLWVAECNWIPKRISVWNANGTFDTAFYGSTLYGGGGFIDPKDRTRFYYYGMEFKVDDWTAGRWHLDKINWRSDSAYGGWLKTRGVSLNAWDIISFPVNPHPIHYQGRQYFSNSYDASSGTSVLALWELRNGVAVPVFVMGSNMHVATPDGQMRDQLGSPLQRAVKSLGVNLPSDWMNNKVFFIWLDKNNDQRLSADEIETRNTGASGPWNNTITETMAMVAGGYYIPTPAIDANGVPQFRLANMVQWPVATGADGRYDGPAMFTRDSIYVLSPDPWRDALPGVSFLKGYRNNQLIWSFPSQYPGVHQSQRAPKPSNNWSIIGTTRFAGPSVRVGNKNFIALVTNKGYYSVLTSDGYFVSNLFNDCRVKPGWQNQPAMAQGDLVNDLSFGEEAFGPTWTGTDNGEVYLSVGQMHNSIVKVEGLETVQHLPKIPLTITQANVNAVIASMKATD